jgi:hypothetical protein
VAPGLVDWVSKFAAPNFYYVHLPSVGQRADRELDGTVLVEPKAFERIGGFDEVFRGWGGEDFDIRLRLTASGVGRSALPPLLTPIRHDNAERVVFHEIKTRNCSSSSIASTWRQSGN